MDHFANRPNPLPSSPGDTVDPAPPHTVDPAQVPTAVEAEDVACWRCGKRIPVSSLTCPVCRAPARHSVPVEGVSSPGVTIVGAPPAPVSAARQRLHPGSVRPPVVTVVYFFLAFLCVSVLEALTAHVLFADARPSEDTNQKLRNLITVCDVINSVLAVLAVWFAAKPPAMPLSVSQRFLGWLAGPPMLLAALLLNLTYHALLNNYLDLPEDWTRDESMVGASVTWLVLAICVQPAIFEELFFRYLTLGHLRSVMGMHAAVWVSSLIFGMAHLGAPLSIPVLMVVGVALGYARVWSGSLLLPMLMHAAHNGVVVYLETHS
jgi:membrane protease YdiL (CAAX protease family)